MICKSTRRRCWLTAAVVVPSENGVEDTPAEGIGLILGVAAVQMPHVSYNIIGARAITSLSNVASDLGAEAKLASRRLKISVEDNLPWC